MLDTAGRGAVVGGEKRLAGVAQRAGGAEVEVEAGLLLGRGDGLGRAHVDRWCANTKRGCALSRGERAGAVGLSTEVLLRTEVFVIGFCIVGFGKRDGPMGSDTTRGDIARPVAENIALRIY